MWHVDTWRTGIESRSANPFRIARWFASRSRLAAAAAAAVAEEMPAIRSLRQNAKRNLPAARNLAARLARPTTGFFEFRGRKSFRNCSRLARPRVDLSIETRTWRTIQTNPVVRISQLSLGFEHRHSVPFPLLEEPESLAELEMSMSKRAYIDSLTLPSTWTTKARRRFVLHPRHGDTAEIFGCTRCESSTTLFDREERGRIVLRGRRTLDATTTLNHQITLPSLSESRRNA